MIIRLNAQCKENIKRMAFLLIMGLQVLSIEVYSFSKTSGFDINLNSNKEILSVVLFVFMSYIFMCIKQNDHFNYYLNVLLYLLYYIPINVAFSINDRDYIFCILTNIFYVLLMLSINHNTRRLNNSNCENTSVNYTLVRVGCMLICLMLIAYKMAATGFSVDFKFETDLMYENRANYIHNLSDNLLAYLFRLVVVNGSSFIAPLYLCISLKRKKYFDIVLSLLCIIARYSLTYEKAIILWLPIIGGSYIVFEKMKWNISKTVFRGLTIGMIALEAIYYFYHNSAIYYLIIRRTMFLPAWMSGIYYDFFSKGSKIWFSQSAFLLETIIPDTYSSSPLQLINNYYFSGKMSSPNTGLFGEAYMQAGVLGVFLFPIIFLIIFRFLEKTYRPFGRDVEFIVAILLTITITNQPILSRGAVFSVLIPSVFVYVLSRWRASYY